MTNPPDSTNAPVRSFGFKNLEKIKAKHLAEHGSGEHLFGFKYWHFFDIASDATRAAVKTAVRLSEKLAPTAKWLPYVKTAGSVLPVVGVIGETIHVAGPWENAYHDWQQNKISNAEFAGLSAFYTGYAGSGYLGFASVVVKEALMTGVQKETAISKRYIPHTLSQELQHSGLTDNNISETAWDFSKKIYHSVLGTLSPPPKVVPQQKPSLKQVN